MTVNLVGQALARSALAGAEIREMFALFQACYEGATDALFRRDLNEKQWVILLRDGETQAIQGFSTLAAYETVCHGQRLGVIYSGDTIIHPAYWGTPELPRAWIKTVLNIGQQLPKPLYWLLISSGYKTYRFLTVFFKEFYPRYDRPTPPNIRALMRHLAGERFGTDYDPERGIVRFARGATPLRPGVAELSDKRLQDPQVAFFVAQNPGHAQGDELVCLAHLHPDNFTAAGRRMAR